MKRNRRIVAILGSFAIVLVLAIGTVAAAGPGTFVVSLLGGGAQQGGVTITGACQDSQPVVVEFQNVYDETSGAFVVDGLSVADIEPACLGGSVVVNGDNDFTFSLAGVDTGTGTASFAAGLFPVGSIGSLDIILTEQ